MGAWTVVESYDIIAQSNVACITLRRTVTTVHTRLRMPRAAYQLLQTSRDGQRIWLGFYTGPRSQMSFREPGKIEKEKTMRLASEKTRYPSVRLGPIFRLWVHRKNGRKTGKKVHKSAWVYGEPCTKSHTLIPAYNGSREKEAGRRRCRLAGRTPIEKRDEWVARISFNPHLSSWYPSFPKNDFSTSVCPLSSFHDCSTTYRRIGRADTIQENRRDAHARKDLWDRLFAFYTSHGLVVYVKLSFFGLGIFVVRMRGWDGEEGAGEWGKKRKEIEG